MKSGFFLLKPAFFLKKTLFLWLLLFFLPLKGQGNAQTPASTTVKVTVGFEGFLLEQMISVPNLRERAIGEWVTPETQEVKESLANENPPVEDKPPSSFSPQGLPAAKNQPLKVPQTRSFPQPFTRGTPSSPSPPELSSTPPSKPKTRKEAIKAFLQRRPDIREFIERNTGIKDDLAILEKWVYDVMKSSDSDWAEAKDIIENYPDK